MSGRTAALAAVIVGALAGGAAVWAADKGGPAPENRAQMEAVVHDYILAHPEIIPEAMERLEAKKTATAIGADRKALETPFAGAWAGAKDGDVTLVEFTDYACGYCRKTVPDLDRLLAEDKHLKIVWREIPILSPESETAAQAALAAAEQGRYAGIHHALFAGGQLSDDKIAADARAAGLPANAGDDPKIKAELEANLAMAGRLGVNATPTFVVGDQLLAGALGYDALKQAVDAARKAKG